MTQIKPAKDALSLTRIFGIDFFVAKPSGDAFSADVIVPAWFNMSVSRADIAFFDISRTTVPMVLCASAGTTDQHFVHVMVKDDVLPEVLDNSTLIPQESLDEYLKKRAEAQAAAAAAASATAAAEEAEKGDDGPKEPEAEDAKGGEKKAEAVEEADESDKKSEDAQAAAVSTATAAATAETKMDEEPDTEETKGDEKKAEAAEKSDEKKAADEEEPGKDKGGDSKGGKHYGKGRKAHEEVLIEFPMDACLGYCNC